MAQPLGMEDGDEERATMAAGEGLPELRVSQVGWIFRDGGYVAIERQEDGASTDVLVE